MAITSSTVFNKVRLSDEVDDSVTNYISRIDLYQDNTFVEALQPIESNPFRGWDSTSDEFEIVKTAIETGGATFRYRDKGENVYEADGVPARLQWMVDANPIKREIDNEQRIDDTETFPSALMVYKAATVAPTEEPPSWSRTNNTWDKWRTAIETAGFSVITPPTPGDGEFLWETKGTYARTGGDYECVWDEWDTNSTLYSTDNGATYTTVRPANNLSGNSSITHVRRYNEELGQWVDEPFSPDFQGTSGTGTALRQRSTGEFTSGNQFIGASIDLPRAYNLRGLQNGRTTKVGIELLYREEWHGDVLLRGYTEILDDMIPLVAPGKITDDSAAVPVAGSTFLFAMDNVGRMDWGLIDDADRVTDHYGDHHRFTAVFRSNPVGRLAAAITATQTQLRLDVRPTGISVGNRLHLVASDGHVESLGVTAVDNTERTAPEGYTYHNVTVTRGGEDGARAWDRNARWYASSRSQVHGSLVITDKHNIHAASEVKVWQVLDQ